MEEEKDSRTPQSTATQQQKQQQDKEQQSVQPSVLPTSKGKSLSNTATGSKRSERRKKGPRTPIRKPSESAISRVNNRSTSQAPQQSINKSHQVLRLNKRAKKIKPPREKLADGETVKSDEHEWKVIKLLGSGGFGDVYRVRRVDKDKKDVKEEKSSTADENNNAKDDKDKNSKENQSKEASKESKKETPKKESWKVEKAMKTEMVEGDKRVLRLKIEVLVLKLCSEISQPERRKHFVEFVDRGKTEKFKFLVMGLVGPSLEDIRKTILFRNYSRSTAMQTALQSLQGIWDLHEIGYLHRDIKPQNFAVGLAEMENIVYVLDFGIARKFTTGEIGTKAVKIPRSKVKFLGTLRFASRACHHGIEQGRKDDLEAWLYMVFDLFDEEHGLPWKRAIDRSSVVLVKEKFFLSVYPKAYKIVPSEFKRILEYTNELGYPDEPDYVFIVNSLKSIAKEHSIDLDKKLDWQGKTKREKEKDERDSDSSDNRQSGSDDSDSSEDDKKTKKKKTPKKKKK